MNQNLEALIEEHAKVMAEQMVKAAQWAGSEEDVRHECNKLIDDYRARFANPYAAAERGYIDDVILPHETRPRLIKALALLKTKRVERPKRKHGNIPL